MRIQLRTIWHENLTIIKFYEGFTESVSLQYNY